MKTEKLTEMQMKALEHARNEGAVFAGHNYRRDGGRFLVAASTLRALAARGLLTIGLSPDGGMMGLPTASASVNGEAA